MEPYFSGANTLLGTQLAYDVMRRWQGEGLRRNDVTAVCMEI